MDITCPHCGKEIDLMAAGDIKKEFGIGPNVVADAEKTGELPALLKTNNRFFYFRDAVISYAQQRNLGRIDRVVGPLAEDLLKMPPEEQAEALRRLQEKLSGGATAKEPEAPAKRPRKRVPPA